MDGNRKKRHIPFWITILVIGIVLFVVGIILTFNSDSGSFFETKYIERSFDGTNISSIRLESGVANLRVEKSDNNIIYIKGENLIKDSYNFIADNGELKILLKKKSNFVSIFPSKKPSQLTVKLPDKIYDNLDFDAGVGEISFIGLTFNRAEIDCGVGKSVFKDVKVLGNADIDLGAGNTRFENCEFNRTEIDSGVGKVYYSGKLLGNSEMAFGVGDVTLDIDGYANEYDINCKEGLGKVKVNKSYSSTVTHAPIRLDIDSGVGEVTINFK